jgi:hypothetical protein
VKSAGFGSRVNARRDVAFVACLLCVAAFFAFRVTQFRSQSPEPHQQISLTTTRAFCSLHAWLGIQLLCLNLFPRDWLVM